MNIKIGDKVKLSHYEQYSDYKRHKGEIGIVDYYISSNEVSIRWNDGGTSTATLIKNSSLATVIKINSKLSQIKKQILK